MAVHYTKQSGESLVDLNAEGTEPFEQVEQSALMVVKESLSSDKLKWRFQVVGWGLSQSRHIWRQEVFTQSLQQFAWENMDAYLDHPTKTEEKELPERSVLKKVGWWSDFEVTPQGLDATLNLKPSAAWVGEDIDAAYQSGNNKFYAASINVAHRANQVTWTDNKPATDPIIVKPITIDLVTVAAADGYVKHALASMREGQSTGDEPTMKEFLEMLFRTNASRFTVVRQSLVSQVEGVTMESNESQIAQLIADNQEVSKKAIALMTETVQQAAIPAPVAPEASGEIGWTRFPQSLRDMAISSAITASDLPEAVQQSIRKRIGTEATLDDVEDEIEAARAYLGTMTAQSGFNNGRPEVLAESADKLTIGLAKSFGLSRDDFNSCESHYGRYVRQSGGGNGEASQDLWNTVSPLRSIRQLYVDLTGDTEVSGRHQMVQRITRQATWLTSDFTEILANVMGKRLLRDFRSLEPTWKRIAVIKPVSDFKTQEAILVGEFGDLPTVAEDGTYQEPSALSDTQETYSVGKKGRVVSLSWETVRNDDLNAFVRMFGKLGRAGARTLLKFVWNTCFMSNPTLAADSVALFHATHNNLITDALGTTGLKNAITALLNQTEPGSNEKMNVDTMNLTLAVPPGLYLDAQSLTDFNNSPGGETSALAQLVKRMGITPVAVPFFSDANDWALCASPDDREIVEIGFLDGREEPEFFTQNDPTQGDAFAKDTVAKYKIRFVYGGVPVDFRGAVKSSVA
jgi:hypothetical protein